jgi:hypothetical protein
MVDRRETASMIVIRVKLLMNRSRIGFRMGSETDIDGAYGFWYKAA